MRPETGRRVRGLIGSVLFHALLLASVGLLGWLSEGHYARFDWTHAGRNSVSEVTRTLLEGMPAPIAVTAYARENDPLRGRIRALLARYQQQKPDLSLHFADPDAHPARARGLGLSPATELLVEYRGRTEHVTELSERGVSSALVRLARAAERYVAYLSGHGERDLLGRRNHDLGRFGELLAERGLAPRPVNLAELGAVPDNAALLVLADPQVDLLAAEAETVRAFVARGGNLLWLLEPGPSRGLEALSEELGVSAHRGTVVDPAAPLAGIEDPRFVLVTRYAERAPTAGLDQVSVYPVAAGLTLAPRAGWDGFVLASTGARSWIETGALDQASFDPSADLPGPAHVAVALTRPAPAAAPAGTTRQRVVVVGDGDFLANAYLGNGANRTLGLRMLDWLAGDETLVQIPPRIGPDANLQLGRGAQLVIAVGALFALPLLLLGSGLAIAWRRRRA